MKEKVLESVIKFVISIPCIVYVSLVLTCPKWPVKLPSGRGGPSPGALVVRLIVLPILILSQMLLATLFCFTPHLVFNTNWILGRSETDIINVVEQRIWHSMEEGQFENLPGKGKPLKLDANPHADPAEDTLYRILSKNGCAPEWVELNKEIRSKISEWRISLKKAWATKCGGEHSQWVESSENLKLQLREINDKVRSSTIMFPGKWNGELNSWSFYIFNSSHN